MEEFDLIVIGGGSGGISAAIQAAKLGARVALIEGEYLGGTCVNTGCVPKKIMWFAGNCALAIKQGPAYGFEIDNTSFNWKKFVKERQSFIKKLNQIYFEKLKANNINFISGYAEIIDSQTLQVKDKCYSTKNIIIATGGKPIMPTIPGADLGINSDDFFALRHQPKSVAVVGSGYIAVELASLLKVLGSKVQLILRKEEILCHFDRTVAKHLQESLSKNGIEILTNHVAKELKKEKEHLILYCKNDKKVTNFDCLIWAIGRSPHTEQLKLNKLGIDLTSKGFIRTDKKHNTNTSFVYAIGDVTGNKALTPIAVAQGRQLVNRLFSHEAISISEEYIPSVVFTHPPLATVGLSEAEAIKEYSLDEISIVTRTFTPLSQVLQTNPDKTLIKIISLKKDKKIIGCHLCGENVDEMLQGIAIAITKGITLDDLRRTLPVHPTSSEELIFIGGS